MTKHTLERAEAAGGLLADISNERFYEGLALLRTSSLPKNDVLRVAVVAVNQAPLAERQIALRVNALIEAIAPGHADIVSLAPLPLSLGTRNALMSGLPAHLRSAFRKGEERRSSEPPEAIRLTESGRLGNGSDGRDDDETSSTRTVVILSLTQKDAARNLLSRRGYRPLTITDISRYRSEIESNADICAVLVDGSLLQPLSGDAQRELFKITAQYSSFVWIRIEGDGLKLTAFDLRQLLKRVRCQGRAVASHELSIQSGPLADSELDDLNRAGNVLQQHSRAAFLPGELSPMERRVLVAAAYEWHDRMNVDGAISVERVETRFLQGGFKKVRVASVLVNGARRPIVAKFSSKDHLADELRRFQKYVQPIDDKIDPVLGYHGDAAVLLVALVQREHEADEPAETLDEVLTSFRFSSWSDPSTSRAELLFHAIKNAAYVLLQLNEQRAPAGERPCQIFLSNVEAAERQGVSWGIDGGTIASRRVAQQRFDRLGAAAVTHNDLHLRNILVRGTDAHLIDYESCGAGHPAVDLARLEIALFSGFLFPQASDAVHVTMQTSINDPGVTFDRFCSDFDVESQPAINKLCLRAIFAVRDYAVKAVSAHGGDVEDYAAAKYLVAWQTLLLDGKQVSLVRSVIESLAPRYN